MDERDDNVCLPCTEEIYRFCLLSIFANQDVEILSSGHVHALMDNDIQESEAEIKKSSPTNQITSCSIGRVPYVCYRCTKHF